MYSIGTCISCAGIVKSPVFGSNIAPTTASLYKNIYCKVPSQAGTLFGGGITTSSPTLFTSSFVTIVINEAVAQIVVRLSQIVARLSLLA